MFFSLLLNKPYMLFALVLAYYLHSSPLVEGEKGHVRAHQNTVKKP